MQLFDTHFHFYGEVTPVEYMRNVNEALADEKQSAVGKVEKLFLNAVGADFKESLNAQRFAGQVDDCVFSCGVHPHSAQEYLQEQQDFAIFKDDPRLAAIGELGIDLFYDYSDLSAQMKVFEKFLGLALDWNLPAVVHIRDKEDSFHAYSEAYRLLSDFAGDKGRFVIHCFAGNTHWAEKFISLGCFCGVTGIVTFKKAENIRENLRVIPLDRLLIETDSPYLAPVPHRGKENHPGFLIHAAAHVAKEYGISLDELARITTQNGKDFLGVK